MRNLTGFILTADYIDHHDGRHELSFFGKSSTGPFHILIDNSSPLFFIERSAQIPSAKMTFERKEVALKSFGSQKVDALYFKNQKDLFQMRSQLETQGIRTFEADVRPAERYLMERFINGEVEIIGESTLISGLDTYRNPQLKPAKSHFFPSIISLDIETSMQNDLYSVGFHYEDQHETVQRVLMVGEARIDKSDLLSLYPTEKELLQNFLLEFQNLDPDLILGWHVIGFDLIFLEKKFAEHRLPFTLGRQNKKIRLTERKGSGFFANIPGRVVMDGPVTLRSAFYSFTNFKLDTVAKELLGTGKDIEMTGAEKIAEIEHRFHHDKEALAKYNLLDCTLVIDIFKHIDLIQLQITRTRISGLLLDRLGVSTGAFDHFFLPLLHRKNYVAPNILDIERTSGASGGHVLEPSVGIHENVIVLDFKSLYPSIMKTFFIDPYSRLVGHVNPIKTPTGFSFSSTEHILPSFIDKLFKKRELAKERGDIHLSQAIKILMNSFYGVLGSSGCRFYHADLPAAITSTGKWILQTAVGFLDKSGYEVIYGDTDSVFVKLNSSDLGNVQDKAAFLSKELNEYFKRKLEREFNVETHLEIEFEKYYRTFFLPLARNGTVGAKKRYAGLLVKDGKEELYFAGMEFVRSDSTNLAKKFQYELFRRLFYKEDIELYIKEVVHDLLDGIYDQDLTYTKRLTKELSEYIKNIPPHVRAAKQLDESEMKYLKSISYVITLRGPVPKLHKPTDFDYQHYIEKQIKPLANNVLNLLDKNFDDLIVGNQLSLF